VAAWGVNKRRRGFALVITLLFLSLLVVMVSALFLTVRGKMFQSQTYHDQVAALYLAELALADAMVELEADPRWTAGFSGKTSPGSPGRYSLSFNTRDTGFGPNDSINNVAGKSPHSHRGEGTVPRGHCLLIVTAEVGNSFRTLEALVQLGGGFLEELDKPLSIDGKALLRGYVTIEGVKSLSDPQPVPAGIHSNLDTAAPDLVVVDSVAPLITGQVSSSSSDPSAINLGGYVPVGGTTTAAPKIPVENIPIIAIVNSHLGGTPVPWPASPGPPPGYTVLPPILGTVQLTHQAGPDYSHSGNLSITGDLVLSGASLYVSGDLNVNGSISGDGAVWVAGETSLFGTARVTSSTPDRVALYSHGGVTLRGFDGSQALQTYAAAVPSIATSWHTVRTGLADYPAELSQVAGVEDLGPESPLFDAPVNTPPPYPSRVDLGSGFGGALSPQKGAAGNLSTSSALRHFSGSPGQALLLSQAPSSARDFLARRFFDLYSYNYGMADGTADELVAKAEAQAGRLGFGGVDAINDNYLIDRVPLIASMVAGTDFDHPGQAVFQGQVYTHGYFVATNEVAVIGAVVTCLDPANPTSPTVVGGRTVQAGDVLLEGGSRLLYVEEFFKPRRVAAAGDRGAQVVWWDAR
jgi:hypothetical protein